MLSPSELAMVMAEPAARFAHSQVSTLKTPGFRRIWCDEVRDLTSRAMPEGRFAHSQVSTLKTPGLRRIRCDEVRGKPGDVVLVPHLCSFARIPLSGLFQIRDLLAAEFKAPGLLLIGTGSLHN
jgi:hypothetical protein